ncbi:hypothetical protein P389DRAFT_196667 [Cystobasidium minutum MCA 4210]|uniref:uncharacterized protein n=1 Tax=Cystobasidium minutum MCA 4210 TaxID=1397322 RepID=UPI0034CDAD8F|eukprot:jgi/Rhomi1/196667/gm1.4881_g
MDCSSPWSAPAVLFSPDIADAHAQVKELLDDDEVESYLLQGGISPLSFSNMMHSDIKKRLHQTDYMRLCPHHYNFEVPQPPRGLLDSSHRAERQNTLEFVQQHLGGQATIAQIVVIVIQRTALANMAMLQGNACDLTLPITSRPAYLMHLIEHNMICALILSDADQLFADPATVQHLPSSHGFILQASLAVYTSIRNSSRQPLSSSSRSLHGLYFHGPASENKSQTIFVCLINWSVLEGKEHFEHSSP